MMGFFTKAEYRIAGKFGGDFNLAVWRIARASPNLNPSLIINMT